MPSSPLADGIPGCRKTDLGIIPVPLQEEAGCWLGTCDPPSPGFWESWPGTNAPREAEEEEEDVLLFWISRPSCVSYDPARRAGPLGPLTPSWSASASVGGGEAWRPDGCPCCWWQRCWRRRRVARAPRETARGSTRVPGGGRVTGAVSNPPHPSFNSYILLL